MNAKWCVALACALWGASPGDEPTLEIYDVRDIARRDQLVPGAEPMEFLKFVLVHDVIDASADVDLQTATDSLVLRAPAAQQIRVKAFLAQMRSRAEDRVKVQVQLVTFDADQLENIAPRNEPVVMNGWTGVNARGPITMVPPVSVRPLERGQVAVTEKVPYIVAYKAYETLLPLEGRVVVPSIEEVRSGQTLDVIAVPLDANRYAVRLHAQDTTLVKPVLSVVTDLGPVAVPETHVATVDSTLTLSVGETAVLPIPGKGETRQAFFVRMTTKD